jgi:hypothetical protein
MKPFITLLVHVNKSRTRDGNIILNEGYILAKQQQKLKI